MSFRNKIKKTLIEQQNKRYRYRLAKKEVDYTRWILSAEKDYLIQYHVNKDQVYDNDFLIFHSRSGKLSIHAEAVIRNYFLRHPEVLIAYGDEDVGNEDGTRQCPWHKPDWSPDTFQSFFYLGSVVAVRKSLLRRIGWKEEALARCKVSFETFTTRQEFTQLIRELVIECGGYTTANHHHSVIGHIPFVLFHCRILKDMWDYLSMEIYRVYNEKAMIDYEPESVPMVSIIIPSKDNPEVLEKAITSLIEQKNDLYYEIIIVDNGSNDENKAIIESLIKVLERKRPVYYLYEAMPFNFSRMCNRGAEHAKGKFLLFMNDDVTLYQPNTVQLMMEQTAKEYAGAVGLKLFYPDSITIQHAGITNLPIGPVHKLQFHTDDRDYYFGRNTANYNVMAVTGACLMVEKKKFMEAGGFYEKLEIAFNDVDFCFTLEKLGYYNVVINSLYAYHHESLSRGGDETQEKLERLKRERTLLYERHPELEGKDPYYPDDLNREGLDIGIRPAYLLAKNRPQKAAFSLMKDNISDYREDACLLLSIENDRRDRIQGFGVVLGDNNACYEKMIILKSVSGETLLVQSLYEQYRPDLEENMKDQCNVALCGFCVELAEENIGSDNNASEQYRIGMLARNKITNLKLINWSNYFIDLSLTTINGNAAGESLGK